MTDLDLLKHSEAALKAAYLDAGGALGHHLSKNSCPLCADSNGFSLEAGSKGESGIQAFKCHRCGRKGTIVDLLMYHRGISDGEAIKAALAQYGQLAGCGAGGANPSLPPKKKKEGRFFPSFIELEQFWTDIFAWEGGKLEFTWTYENAKGEPAIKILRYQVPNPKRPGEFKKEIRPNYMCGNGWRTSLGTYGRGGTLCPLYGLPRLLKADPEMTLHVVEGEKCADAVLQLGLLATTACMGSSNVPYTDWAPAARFKRIVLVPDIDETGALDVKTGKRHEDNPGVHYIEEAAAAIQAARRAA